MKKFFLLAPVLIILVFTAHAQQNKTKKLTAADYELATQSLGFNTNKLIYHNSVHPNWLENGTFWYASSTPARHEYVLFDPANGSRKTATGLKVLVPNVSETGRRSNNTEVLSPNGKKSVFIKDWNLWIRDIESKKESPLTTDGIKNFGYATDNAGWKHTDRPIVLWSPDSKKIATFQQDQRHVSDMYLVRTKVGEPELEIWKYPIPEDSAIIQIHRIIIEVDSAKIIRLKMGADPRRGTLCDDIACSGSFDDNEWSDDGSKLAFVSTSRDHKVEKMRISDANTGEVKDLFEEKVETQYESGQGMINWHFLPASNEIIWYSERDNWGHLYLYNATTGELKSQITTGDFVVTRLLKVDEKNRVLYFEANGKEKGRDPYFSHFYRVGFNGKNLQLLTPEDGHHTIELSPDGKYFVDNYSKPNVPAVSVLRI